LKAIDISQSPEQIKFQLKDINPTDIKVGIKTLKTFRDGRILNRNRQRGGNKLPQLGD
jgi:hypothetical protein